MFFWGERGGTQGSELSASSTLLVGGGGGTGGLNFPLPLPFNPGSHPIFVASHLFALFLDWKILHNYAYFSPYLSCFPSHFSHHPYTSHPSTFYFHFLTFLGGLPLPMFFACKLKFPLLLLLPTIYRTPLPARPSLWPPLTEFLCTFLPGIY